MLTRTDLNTIDTLTTLYPDFSDEDIDDLSTSQGYSNEFTSFWKTASAVRRKRAQAQSSSPETSTKR